nr:hybrid signal transduction histidine kinase M [Tanacetum cinerariifolium]
MTFKLRVSGTDSRKSHTSLPSAASMTYVGWEDQYNILPQTAEGKNREDLIRSRSIALKAELSSLKLRDLSIDAYFRKIESIATILTSLGSPISNDDVVTIALEGLPDKY